MTHIRFGGATVLLAILLALTGCGGSEAKLPPLTEVEGVLLLAGQPLPFARVTFNPTGSGLPANGAGSGITDEKGKFTLTTAGQPGAVPGEHVVTVVEGPPPEGTRGEEAQAKLTEYQTGLKNRPIPARYAEINKSGVHVTVKTDQKEYRIELNR